MVLDRCDAQTDLLERLRLTKRVDGHKRGAVAQRESHEAFASFKIEREVICMRAKRFFSTSNNESNGIAAACSFEDSRDAFGRGRDHASARSTWIE